MLNALGTIFSRQTDIEIFFLFFLKQVLTFHGDNWIKCQILFSGEKLENY